MKFIYGIIISILYSIIVLPAKEGISPLINPTIYPLLYNGMIIVPLSCIKAIHIHHWLICLVCLIYLINYNKYNNILKGFLCGLMIQGLTYQDKFNFICTNPY